MAARKILDILAEKISIYYSNCQCVKKIGIIYPGVNYDSLKIKTIFIFSSLLFFYLINVEYLRMYYNLILDLLSFVSASLYVLFGH